jgi:hypothetical protein
MEEEIRKRCLHCKEKVPERPLYFANAEAKKKGYCAWSCWCAAEEGKAFEELAKITINKKEK